MQLGENDTQHHRLFPEEDLQPVNLYINLESEQDKEGHLLLLTSLGHNDRHLALNDWFIHTYTL